MANSNIVFALTITDDIEAYEIPGKLVHAEGVPNEARERRSWCVKHGKHVATRNVGTKWWWVWDIRKSKWERDRSGWWADRFKEIGEPPPYAEKATR